MSKIAEQKALEVYPIKITRSETGTSIGEKYDTNYINRQIYIQGYDQAMKDFLEKAERWLEPTFKNIAGYNCGGDLMNNFKNYMQDES